MSKQIRRVKYGFLPGNAVAVVTLTRNAPNARRAYTVEYTFRNETFSYDYRTARAAIGAYRDTFKSRHGIAAECSAAECSAIADKAADLLQSLASI